MKISLLETLLQEIDLNMNEAISFDEFVRLCTKYLKNHMLDFKEETDYQILTRMKKHVREVVGFDQWIY